MPTISKTKPIQQENEDSFQPFEETSTPESEIQTPVQSQILVTRPARSLAIEEEEEPLIDRRSITRSKQEKRRDKKKKQKERKRKSLEVCFQSY
jgi:hypothetical protein